MTINTKKHGYLHITGKVDLDGLLKTMTNEEAIQEMCDDKDVRVMKNGKLLTQF